MTFPATAGIAYRLWVRGKAQNNHWGNDSVFVQFSGSVNSGGGVIYRIGTTSAAEVNLEDCSGCGLSGWGWQDNGWGVGVMGPLIYFQATGSQTIRVQTREDGLSIDQIVLSPATYLNNSPGALRNDNTILPKSGVAPPTLTPTVTAISPSSGAAAGGTQVTITGTNFSTGATVTIGGAATNVSVISSTSIRAITPAHAAGTVNVVVTSSNGQSGTLANGFTYTSAAETVLLEDDFSDNLLDFAKWTPDALFSGYTDPAVPVNEVAQRLQLGPLVRGQSGSHYNGVRSLRAYDFTSGYCYVELVQGPDSTTKADAMFTIGKDVSNYYRIYIEEGALICQKRIAGVKATVFSTPYDPVAHRYWRIRHDQATGRVVFETAPQSSAGVPGSWVIRHGEAWAQVAVPLSAIIFEIKAGTWQSESVAPGSVVIDNFKAAKP
jgi:hypothetical protein